MKVAVPKKLTKEQRKLVEELRRTMGGDGIVDATPQDEEKPFFERVKDIFG